ncbi:hypothetical protein G8759_31315 [Spirosoma aureum]|uniref:Uncharacterized protein n=1 Tax=Spirosoma aureum TaxID=2692134 RepID=A0A6G9AWS0_9BACT|nr:hypothetical protein [Spirosoma aureum]QIP16814.1 hypothetical protein G8759_31315 [Spirosoma aureum]
MRSTPFSVEKAFERLVSSPYYWRKTGRPQSQRRRLLYKLTKGETISLDKRRALLQEAGWQIQQPEIWIAAS